MSSKFELFQQPSDYNGKLGRITRQLKDIQRNMYLTELISHEPESIHGQLHHTKCIYNVSFKIYAVTEGYIAELELLQKGLVWGSKSFCIYEHTRLVCVGSFIKGSKWIIKFNWAKYFIHFFRPWQI